MNAKTRDALINLANAIEMFADAVTVTGSQAHNVAILKERARQLHAALMGDETIID